MKTGFLLLTLSVLVCVTVVFCDDDDILEIMIKLEDSQVGNDEAAATTTAAPGERRTWRRGPGPHTERRHGEGHREGHKRGKWGHRSGPITLEQKMTFFCSKMNRSSEPCPEMKRKLERLEPEKRQQIIEAWRQKKAEIQPCCAVEGAERIQCAERVKAARLTRVCNNEEPLFSIGRRSGTQSFMTDAVAKCCTLQGDDRTKCFDESKRAAWEGIRARKAGRGRRI